MREFYIRMTSNPPSGPPSAAASARVPPPQQIKNAVLAALDGESRQAFLFPSSCMLGPRLLLLV